MRDLRLSCPSISPPQLSSRQITLVETGNLLAVHFLRREGLDVFRPDLVEYMLLTVFI
jgi:hypothetical protein